MKASELLRRAKALVAREEDWWPGPSRVIRNVHQVCVMQAVNQLAGMYTEAMWLNMPYDSALEYLRVACGPAIASGTRGIVWFNDHHSYAEVMAMWERAIELAEAAEMGAELADIVWAEEPEAVMV